MLSRKAFLWMSAILSAIDDDSDSEAIDRTSGILRYVYLYFPLLVMKMLEVREGRRGHRLLPHDLKASGIEIHQS